MCEGTIPTGNNLIATVGNEIHEEAYIYIQNSISNQ